MSHTSVHFYDADGVQTRVHCKQDNGRWSLSIEEDLGTTVYLTGTPDALRACLRRALDVVEAYDFVGVHSQDEDCDVDEETGCCRSCGVDHTSECAECGGAGFHRFDCRIVGAVEGGEPAVTGLVLRTDGTVEERTFTTLGDYQQAVGGSITGVYLADGSVIYVDDEGLYKNEQHVNPLAMAVASLGAKPGHYHDLGWTLVGDAVLVGPAGPMGEETSVTDQARMWVKRAMEARVSS